MVESMSQISVNGQGWNGQILGNFAEQIGKSLDQLGQEYDEMILTFETQKSQLKNFTPSEGAIPEEKSDRKHSIPTPSDHSNFFSKDEELHQRTHSSAGIHSSIKSARNTLRKKFSSKNSSPSHNAPLSRKKEHSSVTSLSKSDSSYGEAMAGVQQI